MDYDAYLASEQWRRKRAKALARDRYRCVACGSYEAVQVHHRKYPRYPKVLGDEPLDWLVTLCDQHHDRVHLMTGNGMKLGKATNVVLPKQEGHHAADHGPTRRKKIGARALARAKVSGTEIRDGREFTVVKLPPSRR